MIYRRKRKKSFLLLEILIGLTLILECLVPLMLNPISLFQNEIAHLEQIELEREALIAYAQVKEKLYNKEVPWTELKSGNYKLVKEKFYMDFGKLAKREWQKSITLKRKKEDKGKLILLDVTVEFSPVKKKTKGAKQQEFHYFLVLTNT